MSANNWTVSIKKRPLWVLIVGVFWAAIEVLMFQTAVASAWEREPRAATISWVIFALIFAVYVAIWLRTAKND